MQKRSALLLFASLLTGFLNAADYAVTPSGYDDIEAIITPLGLTADTVSESALFNLTTLNQYRAVFVNCSATIESNFDSAAAEATRQYVAGGGVIYASDWAFVVIKNAFPGNISYYGSPKIGNSQTADAAIVNQSMQDYMGVSTLSIDFNLGAWVPIQDVSSDVDVFLRGTSGDSTVNGKPILVKFDYGQGSVIYTSFHNEGGLSGDAVNALEYMVLISVLSTTANNLAATLRSSGFITAKENLDILAPATPKTYTYTQSATSANDLAFAVAWRDSATMGISVTGPGFSNSSSNSTSPLMVTATEAGNGTWNYTVTPTAAGNTAFVVMAAKRISAFDEVTSIKAYPNPFVGNVHTVAVFEGLTQEATVRIYTMRGRLVKTIRKNDGSGTAFWNMDDDNGDLVPGGLYLFTAEGTNGKIQKGKIAVIR